MTIRSEMLNATTGSARDSQVGAAIRLARGEAGLTVRQVAELLGVSAATISAIENDKTGVSVARLEALANAFGTTANSILARRQPQADHTTHIAAVKSDWREFPPLKLDPVLNAAIDAFVETGYHGTSVRQLADRARLSVPGMYHYYPDKQALLVRILEITMAELNWRVDDARRDAENSLDEIARIVEALALFHTHHRKLAFIGASEMRSLTGPNRRRIAAQRTAIQRALDAAIDRARKDGHVHAEKLPTAGRAIATMCTSLPQWFRPDGPESAEEVSRTYVQLALAMLGA
jgi:AcrR family transcriptional regulator